MHLRTMLVMPSFAAAGQCRSVDSPTAVTTATDGQRVREQQRHMHRYTNGCATVLKVSASAHQDGLRCLDGDLVVRLIAVLDAQVEVHRLQGPGTGR